MCEQKGLKNGGKKEEIIARLEEYDANKKKQEQASSSASASSSTVEPDTSVQIELPSRFDIDMRLVNVTMTGTGYGDDYYGEHHSKYIQAGLETGFSMDISDPNGTLTARITSGYGDKSVPELVQGKVYPIYGFEGLKYETPLNKQFSATGNEGTEFSLTYSHAMITVSLPKQEQANPSETKKQKL